MKEKEYSLFNIFNMRSNKSFNNDNDNLNIDEMTKQKKCPLLSTLNKLFTSHTISILLYEIIKSSHEFPDSSVTEIKNPQGSQSKVINIPK